MIKDKRKTKENSKNQEQFINWIKEYFEKAPITITNDKTKLYIAHKNYPISLENTSIIEKFTNKNKGVEFTKEQATKEAENLRNELAVEVKNYKTLGISVAQKLIKEHIVKTFGLENITDIKFIGDYVVSFEHSKYPIQPLDFTGDINAMYIYCKKPLEELDVLDLEDCIDYLDKYDLIVREILKNIVEPKLTAIEDTKYAINYGYDIVEVKSYKTVEVIVDLENSDLTIKDRIDCLIESVDTAISYVLENSEEKEMSVETKKSVENEIVDYILDYLDITKEYLNKEFADLTFTFTSDYEITDNYTDNYIDLKETVTKSLEENEQIKYYLSEEEYFNREYMLNLMFEMADNYLNKKASKNLENTDFELRFKNGAEFCLTYKGFKVKDFEEHIYNNNLAELIEFGEQFIFDCVEHTKDLKSIEADFKGYQEDIKDMLVDMESDIQLKYPDFKINGLNIYTNSSLDSDFDFNIAFNDYSIAIDSSYPLFTHAGLDLDFITPEENVFYAKLPYVNRFDYEAFLEIVEEKLNKVKEEILEDLSK